MPSVSIITPVFNAARWLSETLASVADQSFADWEHILVDDCSSDNSVELIQQAAARDPRIHLLRMPSNSGPARCRNHAIAAAQGRYIALLDADDLWLPNKLDYCVAFLEQQGCAFVYHAFRYLSADGSKTGALVKGAPVLTLRALHTRRGTGDCMSMVIDRRKVTDFRFSDNRGEFHEDWVTWLRLVQAGHIGYLLPVDLGRYRLSERSRNASKLSAARAVWNLYRNVEELPWPRASSWWIQYAFNSFWLHRRSRPRNSGPADAGKVQSASMKIHSTAHFDDVH